MKLNKLEAIRGFAAVYVVLHHTFSKGLLIGGRDFSVFFRFGQEAVILFFLLSGFVIYYAYAQSRDKSVKTFLSKRFLRIYIPLLFVFITNYALVCLSAGARAPIDWWTLGGNLLMLQDSSFLKPGVICGPFLGNQPLWSLSYEWWFYMLFIGITVAAQKRAAAPRRSLLVYAMGTCAALTYLVYPNFLNRELMYLVIWWAGADMARLYIAGQAITLRSMRTPLLVLLVNVGILSINVMLHNHHATPGMSPFLELRHFAFALVTIVLAIAWKKLNWVGFRQTLGLFEPLAPISFGLYISHWFLIATAHYLDGLVGGQLLRFACYTVVCLCFSYLVERVLYVRLNRWIVTRLPKKTGLIVPA